MSIVPSYKEAVLLWNTYQLPESKQNHSLLVAKLALCIARDMHAKRILVDKKVLIAGALLHDIDKNVPHKKGERHPDTGVRLLVELGMNTVALLVQTHPLHAILDPRIAPVSWEEKILFLADKMTKFDTISVDKRFSLWRNEMLPLEEEAVLNASYPKVKVLEQEILSIIGKSEEDVINTCKNSILTEEGDIL